jgi:proteasome lid subunit RPN8/RPN11
MGSSDLDSLTPQELTEGRFNSKGLSISKKLFNVMQVEVSRIFPEEVCGLVAGFHKQGIAVVRLVVPTTNILHSQTRYRMDPYDQLQAFKLFERENLELLAIYHSHPTGPPGPSMTDIRQNYYPKVYYLIWSPKAGEWICRAYKIIDQNTIEVSIKIINYQDL